MARRDYHEPCLCGDPHCNRCFPDADRASDYEAFVAGKAAHAPAFGLADPRVGVADLFPWQRELVAWALRRGRAALFCDTGLGKTRMQLAWAAAVHAATGRDVLVLAPLAVAAQTAREGAAIGVPVAVCREPGDVRPGVNVTNYDRLEKFEVARFGGVVLDESSILKHHDARSRTALIEAFAATPFRLCCTATPAPNDHTELGNHAEFLGVCSRTEMLATYFCHDGGETQVWRLKGHAEGLFWKWVVSWAVAVRRPSDLGHADDGYALPALRLHEHVLAADDFDARAAGTLFALPALDLQTQRAAKRGSLAARVAKVAALVAAEPAEPWLVWCELNDEADALERAIPGAVQVAGSDSPETKEAALLGFTAGAPRVLVTKPSIAGFGMNWQHCARVAFASITHSYEQFYQAVRRCWRFGQARPVEVHVVASETEAAVLASLRRKEADAARLTAGMVAAVRAAQITHVRGATARVSEDYAPATPLRVPAWLRSEAEVAS